MTDPSQTKGIAPYVPPVRRLPLFAYGTLTDPVFVGQLLEHPVTLAPATLLGYQKVELEGFGYPLVVPAEGGRVVGQVLTDVRPADYERLDAYEGVGEDLYLRVEAEVELASGERQTVYVYTASAKTLERYS